MMLIILLILMQLVDSYCSELYEKIQSIYLKELLMTPMDISLNEATVLLNSVAIPFYVIAALAPMSRVLVDYIGKKKVFLISFFVLIIGIIICMTTDNWLLFLLGNSLVSFGCSVDVQYIYIVDKFESNKRGTVRGILAAVAALAGMGVAFVRKINDNWRSVYLTAMIVVVTISIVMLICLSKDTSHKKKNVKSDPKNSEKISVKDILSYLIPLFVWGIGVSGVTFYNEPLSVMLLNDENLVSLAIFVQPVVTVLVTLLSGYFSDKISRKKVIFADIMISIVGAFIFMMVVPGINAMFNGELQLYDSRITNNVQSINAILTGIGWGMMVGGYFAATNLMLLVVTEKAPANGIGRVSTLSSYCNGAGTGIGMVLISVLGNITDVGTAKLLIIIPVSVVTVATLVYLNRRIR